MNIFPWRAPSNKWNKWRHVSGAVVLVCIIYCSNYVFTPLIVGETRLQVALRPRVYIPSSIAGWNVEHCYGLNRYAIANIELKYGTFQMMGKRAALQLCGKPDLEETRGKRQIVYYFLTNQSLAPVYSVFFPRRFKNNGAWALRLEFEGNHVVTANITVLRLPLSK